MAGVDGRDPIEDFDKINTELAEYSERLARRKQLVVANKMDLPEAQENFERLKEYVEAKGYEICKASAATGEGLRELMFKAYDLLLQYVPEEDEEDWHASTRLIRTAMKLLSATIPTGRFAARISSVLLP